MPVTIGAKIMANIRLEKKLSAKSIMEGPIPHVEEAVDLYTIYGKATGLKAYKGTDSTPPGYALTGVFEAVRNDTGEVVAGPRAFLPDPLHSMIVERLLSGDENTSVEFAATVGIRPTGRSIPYEYTVTPHVAPSQSDSLAHLRQTIPAYLLGPVNVPIMLEASTDTDPPLVVPEPPKTAKVGAGKTAKMTETVQ
jgi:hypothetical protein